MEREGRQLTIREQQEVMLEEMKAIHAFFQKHNLRYIMIFGTLLGAVRHKGFIPWDNDMDIGVPRPDYDRLVDLLNSGESIGEHYYHLHYSNDENYHYQIMRICDDRTIVTPPYIRDQPKRMGVWVDIFPFDGIPEKKLSNLLLRMRLFINKKFQIADIYAVRGKKDIGNRVGLVSCALFPHAGKRNRLIDKLLKKTDFETAKAVGDVEDRDGTLQPMKQSDFTDVMLMDFEDAQFYAPKEWENYLVRQYGDYMQLPPVEKRMTHTTNCTWKYEKERE